MILLLSRGGEPECFGRQPANEGVAKAAVASLSAALRRDAFLRRVGRGGRGARQDAGVSLPPGSTPSGMTLPYRSGAPPAPGGVPSLDLS